MKYMCLCVCVTLGWALPLTCWHPSLGFKYNTHHDAMCQAHAQTYSKTRQLFPRRIKCVCVCVFLWAASIRANSDDVSPLEITDLFVYWCFKCRCSHTAAQMGKHIDVFTREFFMTMKIFGCVLNVFSLFFPPSVSFSTQQQSREWSSHPCKGVSAWLCVCVCVCDCCVWDESSTLAPILAEDFGASQTPVGDGSSCPDLKE